MSDRRSGWAAAVGMAVVTAVAIVASVLVVELGAGGQSASADEASAPVRSELANQPTLTRAEVEATIPELDAIVETAMAETSVPGVAVAVVFDDEVIHAQGYGVRTAGGADPVDPETVFQVASLSKPISSTIMSGLVGRGAFAWEDPVSEYNPDFALADADSTEAVSFADLFSHTSGLPGVAGNELEQIGYGRDEILRRLRLVPVEPLGEVYSYSNFGMTAGGESAAVAAGGTWEDLADEVLFGPAGMTSTSMRHEDYLAADNRAELHVETAPGVWSADFERTPDAQAPAGGVSSNVVDLARWMRIMLAQGQLDGERVIDADALALTKEPRIDTRPGAAYGLGWNISTDEAGRARWNHSGAFSVGAATAAAALPEENLGIVVLTNGAPVGVPEAISETYLDYVETGVVADGFVDVWRERFAGVYGEPEDLGERPADPEPARDDGAYVGTYANDYVGEARVVARDGGLALLLGPEGVEFPLTHLDADTFTFVLSPELPSFASRVAFDVGQDGIAKSVTIGEFDVGGLGTLERV